MSDDTRGTATPNEDAPSPGALPRPGAGAKAEGAAPPRAVPYHAPPSIISAGGVDMARAHASNIRPHSPAERAPAEEARVVVSDQAPRRRQQMTTSPRIVVEGGLRAKAPWDAAAGAAGAASAQQLAAAAAATAPPPRRRAWLHITAGIAVPLVIAGFTHRSRLGEPPEPPAEPPVVVAAAVLSAPPAPIVAEPTRAEPALPDDDVDDDAAPPSTNRPVTVARAPDAPSPGERPRRAPARPKPAFKPLFELPEERSRD